MITPLLLAIAIHRAPDVREHHRALWVWKTDAILADAAKQDEFFRFLDAPKGEPKSRVSVIFFACKLPENPAGSRLAEFIGRAHKHSIRVDYLCGENTYAMPEHYSEGVAPLNSVLTYDKSAPKAARFDGLQYDVEPYSLSGWPKDSILTGYIGFLSKCRATIDSSGQKLQLGAAIPRWFDGADLHGLYRSVLDRVDYVAVMDYVSKPDQFVRDAANTVEYAAEKGKDAWLGAEVSALPNEQTATFFALGNAKMEQTFLTAEKAFASSKGFAGVAVEWYDTYVELRP